MFWKKVTCFALQFPAGASQYSVNSPGERGRHAWQSLHHRHTQRAGRGHAHALLQADHAHYQSSQFYQVNVYEKIKKGWAETIIHVWEEGHNSSRASLWLILVFQDAVWGEQESERAAARNGTQARGRSRSHTLWREPAGGLHRESGWGQSCQRSWWTSSWGPHPGGMDAYCYFTTHPQTSTQYIHIQSDGPMFTCLSIPSFHSSLQTSGNSGVQLLDC